MASIALPFSGSVSQAINPWNIFLRTMSEIGLININIGNGNPAIEQEVTEEVGSYGRQIGRMADVMEVLIGTLDEKSLNEEQKAAIRAFRSMLDNVRKIKAAKLKRAVEPSLFGSKVKIAREALPAAVKSSR